MDYEKLFRLDERVAVVIGAGSGIGQAAARGLATHGAFVICADARLEAAEATARELQHGSAALVDVTQAESVRQTFQTVMQEHGRLDIVVTTPAINVRKPLLDYRDEEFDRVIA